MSLLRDIIPTFDKIIDGYLEPIKVAIRLGKDAREAHLARQEAFYAKKDLAQLQQFHAELRDSWYGLIQESMTLRHDVQRNKDSEKFWMEAYSKVSFELETLKNAKK